VMPLVRSWLSTMFSRAAAVSSIVHAALGQGQFAPYIVAMAGTQWSAIVDRGRLP
jgi:hypothetical protein